MLRKLAFTVAVLIFTGIAPVANVCGLTLQAPAAKPTKVGEKQDFPFLQPLPEMNLTGTNYDRGSQDYEIATPGQGDGYRHYQPPGGTVTKQYDVPDSLTPEKLFAAYRPALSQAGWTIDYQGDNDLYAHWNKNGRDIYASLSRDGFAVTEVLPNIPLALNPPGSVKGKPGEHEDFPFLKPLPMMKLTSTDIDPSPLDFWSGRDPSGESVHFAPTGGYVEKQYDVPSSLDNFRFVQSYEAALTKTGWKVTAKDASQGYLYAHYDRNGRNIYLEMDMHENVAVRVAEPPPELTVVLQPPAKTPEAIGDKDDFPYLKPLPQFKFVATGRDGSPLVYYAKRDGEAELVGSDTVDKQYGHPPELANDTFANAYRNALAKAGWTIGAWNPDQGYVYAHYDKNGRDIWAYVHLFEGVHFQVADTGAGLKAALDKGCKVAVYGLNFDFNKATLRPDAMPVLQQILALLKDKPALAIEIGGHTDNIGGSTYNQALSEKRAQAVRNWLIGNGIPAARLTSHGYGDTQPVVPNDTDANRAKNRRVELKKPNCGSS